MVGIRFCGCGWVPVRGFLCLFWRKTHSKALRERFPTKLEEKKEKQGPRAVNRRRGLCRTMWVGCQSRRFICLFWRETRQRILGPEISPYPEVGRGRERELTTRPGREQLALDSREASRIELAWNHGQGQSTPDSGDSSRKDRVQRQWVKMSLIPVALWNFR